MPSKRDIHRRLDRLTPAASPPISALLLSNLKRASGYEDDLSLSTEEADRQLARSIADPEDNQ